MPTRKPRAQTPHVSTHLDEETGVALCEHLGLLTGPCGARARWVVRKGRKHAVASCGACIEGVMESCFPDADMLSIRPL